MGKTIANIFRVGAGIAATVAILAAAGLALVYAATRKR